jgi:hypothetical protein
MHLVTPMKDILRSNPWSGGPILRPVCLFVQGFFVVLIWVFGLLSAVLLFFGLASPVLALVPFGVWIILGLMAANSGAGKRDRAQNAAIAYLLYREHQRRR